MPAALLEKAFGEGIEEMEALEAQLGGDPLDLRRQGRAYPLSPVLGLDIDRGDPGGELGGHRQVLGLEGRGAQHAALVMGHQGDGHLPLVDAADQGPLDVLQGFLGIAVRPLIVDPLPDDRESSAGST